MDGICGIYGPDNSNLVFSTLVALEGVKNRGGYFSGIAIASENGIFISQGKEKPTKAMGSRKVLDLQGYAPHAAIGCFGYAKYQKGGEEDAEPIRVLPKGGSRFQVAVCMDGYVVQANKLETELSEEYTFATNNQSEVFGALFHKYLESCVGSRKLVRDRFYEAGARLIERLDGRATFAATLLAHDTLSHDSYLISIKDSHSFEPLCYGEYEGHLVFVSETSGLDMLRVGIGNELGGAQMCVSGTDESGPEIRSIGKEVLLPDQFQPIYFAAPSSFFLRVLPDGMVNRSEVYECRKKIGKDNVAHYGPENFKAQIAVPIEASGIGVTHGIAEALNVVCEGGLVKNPHSSRTFQDLSDVVTQALEVRGKFSGIRSIIQGNRVVVGDDSIVKASIVDGVSLNGVYGFEGNIDLLNLLSGGAIDTLKYMEPETIEMVISYAPMLFPSFKEWGDTEESAQLATNKLGVHKLGRRFDVDPFTLTLEEINERMAEMFQVSKIRYTPLNVIRACIGEGSYQALNGSYPISEEWTPKYIRELQERFAKADQKALLG